MTKKIGSKDFITKRVSELIASTTLRWPDDVGYELNKRVKVYRAIADRLYELANAMTAEEPEVEE